jgi:hypothetical protein
MQRGIRKFGHTGTVDVSAIMQQGVIVMLGMGRWRAEQRLVEADLLLEKMDPTILRQYIRLGKKTLIKPELQRKLNSIETSARFAIKKIALETPFGLFVTAAAYPALEKTMEEYEKEWMGMAEQLASELERHEVEIREAYRTLAVTLFKTMKQRGSSRSYAAKYASRVTAAIPTPEQVRASFMFNFQVFQVPVPKVFSDAVRKELLGEEKTKLKLATAREREEQTRKMNMMIAERYQKKKDEMVDQFLNGVNSQVRQMVLGTVEKALASIKKNDMVVGRTSQHLRQMIAQFRMLNILNDEELEREVAKLETVMTSAEKGDEQRVKEILTELQSVARNTIMDITAPKRRSRGELLDGSPMVVEATLFPTGKRTARTDVI